MLCVGSLTIAVCRGECPGPGCTAALWVRLLRPDHWWTGPFALLPCYERGVQAVVPHAQYQRPQGMIAETLYA